MGDALCGPSNALQNFQKHASADRTLQQDRLASHSRPGQGFRSQNPNQGALDQEFESFESTFSSAPFPEAQHHQPSPFFPPGVQAPALPPHPQPELASWASDFQQLHISEPPHQASQNHLQNPLHRPVGGSNWQNEFNRQTAQPTQSPSNFGGNLRYGPTMSGMEFAGPGPVPVSHEPSHATSSSAQADTFDEAAFETAFAEAQAEVAQQEDKEEQQQEEPEAHTVPSESVRIGSDQIPAEREGGTTDGDELAKTAGELLDRVSHDQSKKFKESNFLALMRQLRDREVTIQEKEFRQAHQPTDQPLHPGGPFYPEQRMPFSKPEAKGSGAWMGSGSDDHTQDSELPGQETPRDGYHAFASSREESLHNYKRPIGRSTGDDNTLYEGYSLDEFLVDRRTAHPLNCTLHNDLEVPGL